MKKRCYIFDFAPDRALTVMAETDPNKLWCWKEKYPSAKTGYGKLA